MDSNTKRRLLAIRTDKKQHKPSFRRVECWRFVRVKPAWHKARGNTSKTRQKRKSGVKSPDTGYYSPKSIRGFHPSGLQDVLIRTKADLEGLSPKVHGIRIAKNLGVRKKIELLEYTKERGFHILNLGISREELTKAEPIVEKPTEKEAKGKKAQIEKLRNKQEKGEKSEPSEEKNPK
jgi:large subunit ribosomal protein L32e